MRIGIKRIEVKKAKSPPILQKDNSFSSIPEFESFIVEIQRSLLAGQIGWIHYTIHFSDGNSFDGRVCIGRDDGEFNFKKYITNYLIDKKTAMNSTDELNQEIDSFVKKYDLSIQNLPITENYDD